MRRSVLEVSLAESYMRENLSDEQVVHKLFYNIGLIPEKKDYFIRDFDDFYFKIRPKFGAKLIKYLLEGDPMNGVIGLLNFIGETEESFVSACSALQLLAKLIDY